MVDAEKKVQGKETESMTFLYKRIRAWNKKMNQVHKIEEKVKKGDTLTEEQKKILASKEYIEKTLKELESVHEFLQAETKEASSNKQEKAELTTKPSEAPKKPEIRNIINPEEAEDCLTALLGLTHLSLAFDVSTNAEEAKFARNSFFEEQSQPNYSQERFIGSEADIERLVKFTNLIIKREPGNPDSLLQAIQRAKQFFEGSTEEALEGFSFLQLRQHASEIAQSNTFEKFTPSVSAPQQKEQEEEKKQVSNHEQHAEEQKSETNHVSESPAETYAEKVETERAQKDQAQSTERGKENQEQFRQQRYRQRGRGRGRGGRGPHEFRRDYEGKQEQEGGRGGRGERRGGGRGRTHRPKTNRGQQQRTQ